MAAMNFKDIVCSDLRNTGKVVTKQQNFEYCKSFIADRGLVKKDHLLKVVQLMQCLNMEKQHRQASRSTIRHRCK